MTSKEKDIRRHRGSCKIIKKYKNPNNLTLMQIQHNYALELGFKSWSDLINSYD